MGSLICVYAMTQGKRVIINSLWIYLRSIFGMACGIFSVRWVLGALGDLDYGLYGVVGSMTLFVAFLNIQFSVAISRYYAVSLGEAEVAEDKCVALETCRQWFSTAIVVNLLISVLLIGIGYPLGEVAIARQWLVVPSDKVYDCVWLWRFACLSCFVGMLNVPFTAMYNAKQYIAELTIYSFVQTTIRTAFFCYMAYHPGEWLLRYGLVVCLIAIAPQLLICIRAFFVFPECRMRVESMFEGERIRAVFGFVWWQTVGGLGYLARNQGMAIFVNKVFGPRVNAAMSVGNTVSNETAVLTGALNSAFGPPIALYFGMRDLDRFRKYVYRSCKFCTLCTLIFAVPLSLELEEVLTLWLKHPPQHTYTLCMWIMAGVVIEKLSLGFVQAVNASGRVSRFQTWHGLCQSSALLISLAVGFCGGSVDCVGLALMGSMAIMVVTDVIIGSKAVSLAVKDWLRLAVCPNLLVLVVGVACGVIPQLLMDASVLRVCFTAIISVASMMLVVWIRGLDSEEKAFVRDRILSRIPRSK